MASAVYTEPPASRLSISLEGSASASPFPSPSSSFLPPPTPGAHEFAVKPAPPARSGSTAPASARKSGGSQPATSQRLSGSHNGDASSQPYGDGSEPRTNSRPDSSSSSQRTSLNGLQVPQPNGAIQHPAVNEVRTQSVPASPGLVSPMTPTPSSIQRHPSPPPPTDTGAGMTDRSQTPPNAAHSREVSSSTTTPTKQSSSLPPTESAQASTSSSSSSSSKDTTAAAGRESPLSKIIIPDLDQSNLIAEGPSSPSAFSTTSTKSRSRPLSSALSAISTNADPSLFSNRPAPPSPISRRASKAYSTSSTRSRKSSRPPSTSVSRANSMRKSVSGTSARNSPVIQPSPNPHRQSIGSQLAQGGLFPPLPSPHNLNFPLNASLTPTGLSPPISAAATAGSGNSNSLPTTPATATPSTALLSQSQQKRVSTATTSNEIYIKVRDFGFPPTDERHNGLGVDVPKANKVNRLNRRLGPRTLSQMSAESTDGWDEEGEDEAMQMDGFRISLGRLGVGMGWSSAWGSGAGGSGETAADVLERESRERGGYPSRSEMDINFLTGEEGGEGGSEGDFYDADDMDAEYQEGEEEEDMLYPGLYRALYAFEPEGTAEMRLEEDQLVRVVGRGGGVGWAIVIDEKGTSELAANGGTGPKHALVPES
ncbi:hypothetical protein CVT26_001698, partial [Gymnopilus dilepis]